MMGNNLTAEDVNNMSVPTKGAKEDENDELRVENIRLKQEIEELRFRNIAKEEENESLLKDKQNLLSVNEQGIKKIQGEK